jgi:peptide/nickel transport system substrate-binding protein
MRGRLSLFLLALLAALMLAVAGCGGDDNEGSSGSGSTDTTSTSEGAPTGKKGGDITFLAAGDVDYLDPGQSYYTFGYMVGYATHRPLYSFTPEDSANPVPDLADGDPQISEDKKSITVKIKKGVKFAPPVNRDVTSKDVKYAFERAFSANVPSGYASSYFKDIVGVPAEPTKGVKPISGIETPDDSTIVFNLKAPTGTVTAAALVMPISAPVPQEYAEKFDAKSPSTYDQYVVASGPYMVKNDAEGKVVGRDPGKRIEIVRNPNWDANTDFRPAYFDSITIEEGNDDLTVAARRTLQGEKLICCDSGQPPIPVLRTALTRNQDQVKRISGGGTRWIAMNSTQKPFDNVNVRKALIAVADREALLLTRGGKEIGPIATHWIPPGIPGHEESGGLEGFSGEEFDYMQNPKGDPAVAKKYMLAAKKDGVTDIDDNGMYTGGEILAIATNADPGQKTAEVAQAQFEKLGFKINLRKVPQDTLYTKFCGVPKQQVPICPNVGWFKDFADPQSMLEPTFSGDAIKEQGNVNWTQLDVPEINQAMKDYSVIEPGDERNTKWAEVNKMIVAQAPGIPYSWDDNVNLASPDISLVMNGYFASPDLNFSSLK